MNHQRHRSQHSQKQQWVREFEISSGEKHSKGHTVYCVTSIVYPVGFPEASTRIIVEKRFSEFQSLSKALLQIHKNLHLKGKFPSLPKTSYFHRFDEEIVEERRLKCLELLEFAAEHPPLYNNQVFVSFFEASETECDTETSPEDVSPKPKSDSNKSDNQVVLNPASLSDLTQSKNFMDAAVLSTGLAPDSTPALVPTCSVPHPPEMPEYISEAAAEVSMAMKYESEENFSESVQCYRNAISKLLQSVQHDQDPVRAATVKRRISMYISRAEELLNRNEENPNKSMIPRSNKIPHLELFGDVRDLKRYRVTGIIAQKVLLAQDFKEEREVVVKTLQKSALVFKRSKTSMLPINIPFMVKLLCYYETDDAIYLVLEYLPAGELFDVIRNQLTKQCGSIDVSLLPSPSDSDMLLTSPMKFGDDPDSPCVRSVSVIKTSPSFLQERRRSMPEGGYEEGLGGGVHRDSLPTIGVINYDEADNELMDDHDAGDMNIVTLVDEGEHEPSLLCVDNEGIEKIECKDEEEAYDFVDDHLSDEAEEAEEDVPIRPVFRTESTGFTVPEKMIHDSQTLIDNVTNSLEDNDGKVEKILSAIDKIENKIHRHLEGRSLTPLTPQTFSPARHRLIPSLQVNDDSPEDTSIATSVSLGIGDLIPGLKDVEAIPVDLLRQWTSQLCHVLFCLHSRSIIIKDLNPSNILLDNTGNLRLTYQCEWVSVDRQLNPQAFESFYCAPEVRSIQPLTPSCDWWSVGVILYELTTGQRFVETFPSGLLLHTPVEFPQHLEDDSQMTTLLDMIRSFLKPLPEERLGAGSFGPNAVMEHDFLKDVDWNKLSESTVQ